MISKRTKALAFFGAGFLILALAWLQAFRSWTLHRIESAGGGWDMSNIEVWGPMGWQNGALLFLSYSGMAALAASAISRTLGYHRPASQIIPAHDPILISGFGKHG